ncbi:hypothetical protein MKZ38_005787 [Zalerion maritima]|uniref:Uncharacterized protein n=1 Tax=Zalerion maritima TaxID=339359 RepID=A0AAD5RXS0_9PEZI|nr:hypothetical protein MKZ38_005787 [Zalerion maritima]
MSYMDSPIPKLQRQSSAVDFIDNRLSEHHAAFKDPPVVYDCWVLEDLKYWILCPLAPPDTDVNAMKFLAETFSPAMARFLEDLGDIDPKRITTKADAQYSKQGKAGQPRADDGLAEAVGTTANVREAILEGFTDLHLVSVEVEFFLSTFLKDENIRKAAMDLIAQTLEAIEQVTGCYTSSRLSRFKAGLLRSEQYQNDVIETLQCIKSTTDVLIRHGSKSENEQSERHYSTSGIG